MEMPEGVRPVRKALDLLQHPSTVMIRLLPLFLFTLWGVVFVSMSSGTLMEYGTFRWFLLCLLGLLSVRTLVSLVRRDPVFSLLSLGLLLLLLYPMLLEGKRFSAVLHPGQSEPFSEYADISKGPWGTPPDESIGFIELSPEDDQPIRLGIGTGEHRVKIGESFVSGGYEYRVSEIRMAPVFSLFGPEKNLIDSILVKVQEGRSSEEYFQFGVLPYKFYILDSELLDFSVIPRDKVPFPSPLTIGVSRGKIPVIQSAMDQGEPLSFEGLSVKYDIGAPWITLSIIKTTPFPVWIPGLLCLVPGFIMSMTGRRSTTP